MNRILKENSTIEISNSRKIVDDLYDLSYNGMMNIHNEAAYGNSTVELQNGVLAPTDAAMDNFFKD